MSVRAACLALTALSLGASAVLAAPTRHARARLAAATPPPGSHPAWGRTIGSNFGPVTVRKFDPTGFAATYNNWNGRADGEVQGDRVTGYWTQSDGGHPCSTTRDGRKDWGRFTVEFAPDGRSFQGVTGYCDDAPDLPWNSK